MNTVYLITTILCLFLSFIGTSINNKGKLKSERENKPTKIFLILILIVLIIVSGARNLSYIYGDEYRYRNSFNDIRVNKLRALEKTDEPGYWLLNFVIGLFTTNEQWLIYICALITNILIIINLYKHSKYFNFSLFLYITTGTFFTSFNIIRQFLAIAIVFQAINYIIDKKCFKYIICILLATSIHFSSILMLPIYWIMQIKNKKRLYLYITICIVILIVLFNELFSLLNNYDKMKTYYSNYKNENYYGVNIFRILVISIPIILIGTQYKKMSKNNKNFEIYYAFSYISMIIMMLSYKYLYISRLYDFFGIVNLILIPEFVYLIKNQKNRIVFLLLIYILYFLFGYIDASKNHYYYLSYNNIRIESIK